jgi:methanogenic corrinoid protein MtbC1
MQPSATLDQLLAERLRVLARVDPTANNAPISAADLRVLTTASLADDLAAGRALCGALRARGVSVRDILIHLVTPVARHLGELWIEDECDFVHVTVASDLLKRLVLQLSDDLDVHPIDHDTAPQILLLPVPGSQHTLGLLIVAAFFRQARWEVTTVPQLSMDELPVLAGVSDFDVVGFSVGSAAHEPALARAVTLLRSTCSNPDVPVMLGGPAVLADPDLAGRVGADACAADAEEALRIAGELLRELAAEMA